MSDLDDVSLSEDLAAFFVLSVGKIGRESLSYYAKRKKSDILERNYKVRKIEM